MGGSIARIVRPSKPTPAPAPTPAPIMVAPTVAEVSQSEAISADGYDARKTKAKGRSSTIITGPKGLQNETLTLGQKSLLGK
jgi:hypothetical protein|tara:strand:- start:96 stop:341 length:246 start_codon:yes stop_codon:yes gene_type:complete